MIENKRIILKYGKIKDLANEFNVSAFTVRKALRFDKTVVLADYIQKRAIELGGKIFEPIK